MLSLMIAAFTFVYALSDTAAAPYEPPEEPLPVIFDISEDKDVLEEDDPGEEIQDDEPEETPFVYPVYDNFVIITMRETDVNRGPLLLVNHDHDYIIPWELDLVNIAESKTSPYRVHLNSFRLHSSIIEPLDDMMNAFIAETNNRSVTIVSAFRNRETQQQILNNYTARMGRREALRWAALPGHSEHHTGLAFDFGIASGNTWRTFYGTGSTAWFRRNAHNFGFTLRYRQNKTEITQTNYEPWHFRYVSTPHSIIMFENDWAFEEYIEIIREHTFDDPFEFEHEDLNYVIYFTSDTNVKIPVNSEFEISGDNIDGFIVTAILLEFDPDSVSDVSI